MKNNKARRAAKAERPRSRKDRSLDRAILENLWEGIVTSDAGGTIIAANPAAERALGAMRGALLGRPLFRPDWVLLREDGSPWARDPDSALLPVLSGDPGESLVMGRMREDGARVWTRLNPVPVDLPPPYKGRGAVWSLMDITAAYEAKRS